MRKKRSLARDNKIIIMMRIVEDMQKSIIKFCSYI